MYSGRSPHLDLSLGAVVAYRVYLDAWQRTDVRGYPKDRQWSAGRVTTTAPRLPELPVVRRRHA